MKLLIKDERNREILILVLSAISLVISFLDLIPSPIDFSWVAVILCGFPIFKGSVIGLLTDFNIKAGVLVSMALIASIFIGEVFAAGEIAFIMALGEMLEEYTLSKAKKGIGKLINLTPTTARVIKKGIENVIDAKDVVVNDIIKVLPGETVPVDGILINGETSIDQSVMTGESMPVDKRVNDEVFSGTVNLFGAFDMKATKIGENSSLQKMIRLVKSADASKAKIVGLADKWATWIVIIALVSAVLTWFVTGELIRSVTILVVFCPCSLVLATPTAIMAGIGNATKFGILIKEGDALERLSKVKKITFDKTGTLTYGKPKVTRVHSFDKNIDENELLRLVSSVERYSEHPLGKAILSHYNSIFDDSLYKATNFKMAIGKGVYANIDNEKILAGNKKLLEEHNLTLSNEQEKEIKTYIEKGSTIIFVAKDNCIKGFIVLEDVIRDNAKDMIESINKLGKTSILLTGDNKQTAENIANISKIDNVYPECLPEDKLYIIDKLQKNNEQVCMVGDGVNDAPALKKSYVGIAMGAIGSDIAVEAADIALVGDDIKYIPHLLELAKKTMNTVNINIVISMVLNFLSIILAMVGVLDPILGALVHNIGSVVVIIHSALLLKWKSNKLNNIYDNNKITYNKNDFNKESIEQVNI
ncbi:cation-translocating P-type ATPase [Clostridium sp. CCUG 7971]|uniref:heavy metal translocating P-type ATPase n=1 Tax=Clostridium sp. CCUG 7971 TaxID=2811414 RepID=UPI001ABBAC9E|nr:cation-translocating P-type ATPase [Clostridium sp. CCUG 7971]MBO3444523.1 cation-translocating P-type ATPase [Clostridium sp. CCUG 7971]